MWHGGMDAGMMFFLSIAIAGAAIFALRYALPGSNDGDHDDPETVLKRRFAAGEISESEYRAQLRVLRE